MNPNLQEFLSDLYLSGPSYMKKSLDSWREGIAYEVNFWTQWFETKGLRWPADYQMRLTPQPLSGAIENLLPADNNGQTYKILDVGSGPITKIGSVGRQKEVSVTATDPLAFIYSGIIAKHGLDVPIKTQLAFAEDLSARFEEDYFHVVSSTNALDHSIQPVWGIIEMINVLKVGGFVFLSHNRNEAEAENYSGFHHWNFDEQDGQFVIWNKESRFVISDILKDVADIKVEAKHNINVTIRKNMSLNIDKTEYQKRLRANLLEAMIISHQDSL